MCILLRTSGSRKSLASSSRWFRCEHFSIPCYPRSTRSRPWSFSRTSSLGAPRGSVGRYMTSTARVVMGSPLSLSSKSRSRRISRTARSTTRPSRSSNRLNKGSGTSSWSRYTASGCSTSGSTTKRPIRSSTACV